MTPLNSAKCAELQIMVWFLEAGWEVFTPVVDANQTDLVVRVPTTQEILAIQVKHKERGRLNEGWLENQWKEGQIPFDYLVLYQPEKIRGVILHRDSFQNLPHTIEIYLKDQDGYSNRDFRDRYVDVSFDLLTVPEGSRASSFAERLLAIHAGGLKPRAAKKFAPRIPSPARIRTNI
jgi:hypothetical protein